MSEVIDLDARRKAAGQSKIGRQLKVGGETFDLPAILSVDAILRGHRDGKKAEEEGGVYYGNVRAIFGDRAEEAMKLLTVDEVHEIEALYGLWNPPESKASAQPSETTGDPSSGTSAASTD